MLLSPGLHARNSVGGNLHRHDDERFGGGFVAGGDCFCQWHTRRHKLNSVQHSPDKHIADDYFLPPLPSGLGWANKLAVDGSIDVIGIPRFESVAQSGTNLVISGSAGPTNISYTVLTSTNVALALTSWTRLLTNQFDNFGDFIFTNGIDPAVPQKFYRLQVP
jgi:hypothetical protein